MSTLHSLPDGDAGRSENEFQHEQNSTVCCSAAFDYAFHVLYQTACLLFMLKFQVKTARMKKNTRHCWVNEITLAQFGTAGAFSCCSTRSKVHPKHFFVYSAGMHVNSLQPFSRCCFTLCWLFLVEYSLLYAPSCFMNWI